MKTSKGSRSLPLPTISTWWEGGTTTGTSVRNETMAKRLSGMTVHFDSLSRRQCWWHHRPLQKRADRRGLQPKGAGFRAGRRSRLLSSTFVGVACDSQVLMCLVRSIRSKFSPTRSTAERFITLSGGNQKTLSTKTLSRKATSSSTKVTSAALARPLGGRPGRDPC